MTHDGSNPAQSIASQEAPSHAQGGVQVIDLADAEARGQAGAQAPPRPVTDRLVEGAGRLPGAPTDLRTMHRCLSLLLVVVAALGLLPMRMPEAGGAEGWLVSAAAGLAALGALGLWLLAERDLPLWGVRFGVGMGQVLIGVLVLGGGAHAGAYLTLAILFAVYVAYFLPARAAVLHMVGGTAVTAVATWSRPDAADLVIPWVIATGAAAFTAILVAELVRQVNRRTEDLVGVALVARQLARVDADPQVVRRDLCRVVRRACDAVWVGLCVPEGDRMVIAAQAGSELGMESLGRNEVAAMTEAMVTAGPVLTDTDDNADRLAVSLRAAEVRSALFQPVVLDGKVLGVLVVAWDFRVARASEHVVFIAGLYTAEAAVATARAELTERLSQLASADPLTGLANRRAFDLALSDAVGRARATDHPVSLALVDLDAFKAYNDTYGHAAGDALLVETARSWAGVLRAGDVLFRWGGDEFAVVLQGCELEPGLAAMRRLLAATPDGQTASIGVATLGADESAEVLIQRADAALYHVKRQGGGDVHGTGATPAA